MPLVHPWSQAARNDPRHSSEAAPEGRRKGIDPTQLQSGAARPLSPLEKHPCANSALPQEPE